MNNLHSLENIADSDNDISQVMIEENIKKMELNDSNREKYLNAFAVVRFEKQGSLSAAMRLISDYHARIN